MYVLLDHVSTDHAEADDVRHVLPPGVTPRLIDGALP